MNFIPLHELLKHLALFQTLAAFYNLAIRNESLGVMAYISAIATGSVVPPLLGQRSAVTKPASEPMRIPVSSAFTGNLGYGLSPSFLSAIPQTGVGGFTHDSSNTRLAD
jgi:hypothetical protein